MSKAIFIDTSICMGCRACQVACKQWHDLPAEKTKNMGGAQNPQNFSFYTYKLVRMNEEIIDNKLQWLFFPDQCRHCLDAPCMETADNSNAIYHDPDTGAVLYTMNTRSLDSDEIIGACPYEIPRAAADGTLAKCDMCNDRIHNGLLPACLQACPAGAMAFGEREEILALADKRLKVLREKFPKAKLLDADEVSVIYLVAFEPELYSEYASVAGTGRREISRKVAIRKMLSPFKRSLQISGLV